MTSTSKLNEFNHAEDSAYRLLERPGWTYASREDLVGKCGDELEVLEPLKGSVTGALLTSVGSGGGTSRGWCR